MSATEGSSFALTPFWALLSLVLLLVLWYNWRRRWLYYYGSKFEGPPSWPIIGNLPDIVRYNDVYGNFIKILMTHRPITRLWLGNDLTIFNSKPEDVEIIMNTFCEKVKYVRRAAMVLGDGLLVASVPTWKVHRKVINLSFNTNVLKALVPIFGKYSNKVVEDLKSNYQNEEVDLLQKIWKTTVDIACETVANVDSDRITGQEEYTAHVTRMEDILSEWLFGISIHPTFLLRMLKMLKEVRDRSYQTFEFTKKLIKINDELKLRSSLPGRDDDVSNRLILNNLIKEKEKNGRIDDVEILHEVNNFIIASSETTAFAVNFVLVALGIHPEIQQRVYEELDSIIRNDEASFTWDDLNRMEYLERVIKETLRLFAVVPGSARHVHKTTKINNYVYPEGSTVIVPVTFMNRNPDVWDEPNAFNPDRFLPGENDKRHRCAFIPFASGPRNCIGLVYAMLSIKMMVALILKHYTVRSVDYKSIEDIQIIFGVVLKPKDGFRLTLKRRNSGN